MSDQIVDQLLEVQCSDVVSRLRAEVARLTAALASAEARADKMEASLRWADAYLTDTLVHGGQIAHEWHRWWNESLRPALNAAALAEQPGDRGPA